MRVSVGMGVVALVSVGAAGSPPSYEMEVVLEPFYEGFQMTAIGDGGHVTINIPNVQPGSFTAYLWHEGSADKLGAPAGFPGPCLGVDVNGAGLAVGLAATQFSKFAVTWTDLEATLIEGIETSASVSTGINEAGHVTGHFAVDGHPDRAFLWDGARMIDIGIVAGIDTLTEAAAINDADHVAAMSDGAMLLWNGNGWVPAAAFDGDVSIASLTSDDVIAGGGPLDGVTRACAVSEGEVTYFDLIEGTPRGSSSVATGMNDAGLAVGTQAWAGVQAAFVWQGGVTYGLDDLVPGLGEGHVIEATDVNELGQILAIIEWPDGGRAGVILSEVCAADVNGDGELNVLDFVAFQQAFVQQEPAADCDGNGTFNVLDFVCYQGVFGAGCL